MIAIIINITITIININIKKHAHTYTHTHTHTQALKLIDRLDKKCIKYKKNFTMTLKKILISSSNH